MDHVLVGQVRNLLVEVSRLSGRRDVVGWLGACRPFEGELPKLQARPVRHAAEPTYCR
jgi:hypothetical protein